jgi:hypothetical protein
VTADRTEGRGGIINERRNQYSSADQSGDASELILPEEHSKDTRSRSFASFDAFAIPAGMQPNRDRITCFHKQHFTRPLVDERGWLVAAPHGIVAGGQHDVERDLWPDDLLREMGKRRIIADERRVRAGALLNAAESLAVPKPRFPFSGYLPAPPRKRIPAVFKFLRPSNRRTQPAHRTMLSVGQLESREAPASLRIFTPVATLSANLNLLGDTKISVGFLAPAPSPAPTPAPAAQSSSISGLVQIDTGSGPMTPWFASVVTLSINGSPVETVNVNADGSYAFTISLDQAVNYTLQATAADGDMTYVAQPSSGTIQPGQQITGQNLLFVPNE